MSENITVEDRLRIAGYQQRIAEIQAEYENKVMELRVQLTILTGQLEELRSEIDDVDTLDDEEVAYEVVEQ